MRELSDLLAAATPDMERPPTEAIARRGRRRVRRTRAVVAVVMVAGVVAAAGVVRATAPSTRPPAVVDTPTGSPTPTTTPTPTTGTPSGPAQADAGYQAFEMTRLAPGETSTPRVAYLDPADTGDDLVAGVADVLHGMVDGQPVAVELEATVDRQQVRPALVQDPSDPSVVYYNAVLGLKDCVGRPADECRVRHAVRRVDLRAGTDELVAEDAMSVAVGATGRLATVRLDPVEQQLGPPPRGRIAVQDPDGGWILWTSDPARYHLRAWVNQGVVASVDTGDHGEGTDDVAIVDGAGGSRPLVDHGADSIGLIDVSPSGDRALVRRSSGDCCDATLLLVQLDTGQVLDQLDYRVPGLLLEGAGAWLGQSEEAVVAVSGDGMVGGGLQRFRLEHDELDAQAPLSFGAERPFGVYAIAASASQDRVAMVLGERKGEVADAFYVTCRISARRCQISGIGRAPHATYLAELAPSPAG